MDQCMIKKYSNKHDVGYDYKDKNLDGFTVKQHIKRRDRQMM